MATKQEIDALQASENRLSPDQLPIGYTSGGVALWRDPNAPNGTNGSTNINPGYYGSAMTQYNLGQAKGNTTPTPRNPDQTGAGQDFGIDYYKNLAANAPNEATMREQERQAIQGQIDLVNQELVKNLADIGTQRTEYYGEQTGMSARKGLAGSGMGAAQKGKVTSWGAQQEGLANAQAQAQISALMGNADQRATDRFYKEREFQTQAMSDYFGAQKDKQIYDEQQKSNARADFTQFSQLTDRSKVAPEDYQKLADQTQYPKQIFDLMWDSNYTKAQNATEVFKEKTADGKLTIMYQKPDGTIETKKYDWDLGVPTMINGMPYLYDDATKGYKLAENMANQMSVADMKNKYIDAGINYSDTPAVAESKLKNSRIYQDQVRGPVGSGGSKTSSKITDTDRVKEISDYLNVNNLKGTDKKVSWETYLAMQQTWFNNGGDIGSFKVNFPIGNYLDENNQWEYTQRVSP